MMERIEKTVFISYRRTNFYTALAVYQDLTQHGYDVFFDFQSIDSGDFEKIITENIRAKAHFLIILSPSALERCNEPGDWLRREIEMAMEENRNIVPLMMEGFDFGSPSVKQALSGKLASLNRYNGLRLIADYFFEAMEKLRGRYLNVTVEEVVLHPLSAELKETNEVQKISANESAPVETIQLTAEEWFEKGFVFEEAENYDEAIRCYSEAILLQPNFFEAYGNRGNVPRKIGDLIGGIHDYDQVLKINPEDEKAYNNRGNAYRENNDLQGAIKDYNEALRLKPDYALAYINRAHAYRADDNLISALEDYSECIRIDPNQADAYLGRGIVRSENNDLQGALADYNEAIRLKQDNAGAYYSRALAREANNDLKGTLADYDEAIRIRPDHADAYYNRALIWEKKKNYLSAIADYQNYLALGGGERDDDQKEVEQTIKQLKSKSTKKKSIKKKPK